MDIYGIPNCSTVKKARVWLAQQNIDYAFHDFKKTGVSVAQLTLWAEQIHWEELINRQGTTWRKLSDAIKASITTPAAAFALMAEQPSLIKRPVLVHQHRLLVGFNAAKYTTFFS